LDGEVAPLSCQEFISRKVGASSKGILNKKVVPPHHPMDGSLAPGLALNTPIIDYNLEFIISKNCMP
jgi:hypothetical protein